MDFFALGQTLGQFHSSGHVRYRELGLCGGLTAVNVDESGKGDSKSMGNACEKPVHVSKISIVDLSHNPLLLLVEHYLHLQTIHGGQGPGSVRKHDNGLTGRHFVQAPSIHEGGQSQQDGRRVRVADGHTGGIGVTKALPVVGGRDTFEHFFQGLVVVGFFNWRIEPGCEWIFLWWCFGAILFLFRCFFRLFEKVPTPSVQQEQAGV